MSDSKVKRQSMIGNQRASQLITALDVAKVENEKVNNEKPNNAEQGKETKKEPCENEPSLTVKSLVTPRRLENHADKFAPSSPRQNSCSTPTSPRQKPASTKTSRRKKDNKDSRRKSWISGVGKRLSGFFSLYIF